MDIKIKNKCDEKSLCTFLSDRIDGRGLGTRSKGFHILTTLNLKSKKERFFGVTYKSSGKDKGLMINWCPFCGGKPGYFER